MNFIKSKPKKGFNSSIELVKLELHEKAALFYKNFYAYFLKNNFLYINHYKIKCAIGKRGISKNKEKEINCTPRGKFIFEYLLYRKDRLKI